MALLAECVKWAIKWTSLATRILDLVNSKEHMDPRAVINQDAELATGLEFAEMAPIRKIVLEKIDTLSTYLAKWLNPVIGNQSLDVRHVPKRSLKTPNLKAPSLYKCTSWFLKALHCERGDHVVPHVTHQINKGLIVESIHIHGYGLASRENFDPGELRHYGPKHRAENNAEQEPARLNICSGSTGQNRRESVRLSANLSPKNNYIDIGRASCEEDKPRSGHVKHSGRGPPLMFIGGITEYKQQDLVGK
ncbi:hypothetical protein BU17DRAFT_70596 [Hysterangium stoloniferum]|nr:hypothetical protein BU17DRAFT_70596 [Hysterangium stoloniferum]